MTQQPSPPAAGHAESVVQRARRRRLLVGLARRRRRAARSRGAVQRDRREAGARAIGVRSHGRCRVNDQLSLRRLALVLRNDLLRSYRSALVVSGTAALVALRRFAGRRVLRRRRARAAVLSSLLHRRAVRVGHDRHERVLQRSARPRDQHGVSAAAGFGAREDAVAPAASTRSGLIVYLLVFTTVLSWVLEGINTLCVRRAPRVLLAARSSRPGCCCRTSSCAQALFFLGAAWFRKVQFVKTVGAVVGDRARSRVSPSRIASVGSVGPMRASRRRIATSSPAVRVAGRRGARCLLLSCCRRFAGSSRGCA